MDPASGVASPAVPRETLNATDWRQESQRGAAERGRELDSVDASNLVDDGSAPRLMSSLVGERDWRYSR